MYSLTIKNQTLRPSNLSSENAETFLTAVTRPPAPDLFPNEKLTLLNAIVSAGKAIVIRDFEATGMVVSSASSYKKRMNEAIARLALAYKSAKLSAGSLDDKTSYKHLADAVTNLKEACDRLTEAKTYIAEAISQAEQISTNGSDSASMGEFFKEIFHASASDVEKAYKKSQDLYLKLYNRLYKPELVPEFTQ